MHATSVSNHLSLALVLIFSARELDSIFFNKSYLVIHVFVIKYKGLLMLIIIVGMLQIKDGFAEGKDLVVSVMSAMGEEQINALKDIGPK